MEQLLARHGWTRWNPSDDNYDNDACNYAADQSPTGVIYVNDSLANQAIGWHGTGWRHHRVMADGRYFVKVVSSEDLEAHLVSKSDDGFRHVEYNRWTKT